VASAWALLSDVATYRARAMQEKRRNSRRKAQLQKVHMLSSLHALDSWCCAGERTMCDRRLERQLPSVAAVGGGPSRRHQVLNGATAGENAACTSWIKPVACQQVSTAGVAEYAYMTGTCQHCCALCGVLQCPRAIISRTRKAEHVGMLRRFSTVRRICCRLAFFLHFLRLAHSLHT
jgi:hypothetical protein